MPMPALPMGEVKLQRNPQCADLYDQMVIEARGRIGNVITPAMCRSARVVGAEAKSEYHEKICGKQKSPK